MIKVYAITLTLGVLGLLIVIVGGALADNTGGKVSDPGEWMGLRGKMILGGGLGFAMGGMAGEYSPLDFTWQVSLLIALGALIVGVFWVRYALDQASE